MASTQPDSERPFAADERATPLLFSFADPRVVQRIQRHYVALFERRGEGARVLDLGCGRGLFLDLLREAGLAAVGVEVNAEALAECRAKGHEVRRASVHEGLAAAIEAEERYSGVFCSHLIEHLLAPDALELVQRIARVLAPRGQAVLVTPNPRSLEVIGESFWLDPTHVRFYPRKLIEQIGESVGLEVDRSFDDPHTVVRQRWHRQLRTRLWSRLMGFDLNPPMDSVVVLRKP